MIAYHFVADAELDYAALRDLIVDAECAERDGLPEYAAKCRALIAKHEHGGAHAAVLKGEVLNVTPAEQRTCFECGCTVDVDASCCSDEEG